MIVPSIDLMDGQAVQLVQGRRKVLDAGDPRPLAERFGRVGEVAVVDLDAALGRGSNAAVMEELCRIAPCRVGGGIRDRDAALAWLDRGAEKVVLGTAAVPEVLEALPRDRVVAALDAWEGEVVVKGWTERTGRTVAEGMRELRGLAGGFLVTFVEGEGKEGGFPRDRIAPLAAAAGASRLTVAGGITTPEEVAWLDRAGADAQVGMALYRGRLDLGDAFCAPLRSERPDGLWPTVVCDEGGRALGLVWSSRESVRAAIDEGRGIYHSRSRGLWRKGATSGDRQTLRRIDVDCDRDALCFTVEQEGDGFCHLGRWSCFGPARGLRRLERTIRERSANAPEGSLTRRLLDDAPFLAGKLLEEAGEVGEAAADVGAEGGEGGEATANLGSEGGGSRGDGDGGGGSGGKGRRVSRGGRRPDLLPDRGARERRREPGRRRSRARPAQPQGHAAGRPRRRKGPARVGDEAVGGRPVVARRKGADADRRAPADGPRRGSRRSAVRLRRIAAADAGRARPPAVPAELIAPVLEIVESVRTGGEARLRELATRWDGLDEGESLVRTPREMQAALEALPREDRGVLERTARRIARFARAQLASVAPTEVVVEGGRAGDRVLPVRVAGCYAPGGRFPLPSSVLMTAVTARVAGVRDVWVASPRPSREVLAAAAVAGADGLLAAGGAQAVAAMAHGVGPVPRCDVVVGPGNQWVTAAKLLVSGVVGIDLLAGPSELVVLTDGRGDPALIAADLLAQAEHDPAALPILVTTSSELVERVEAELARQLAGLRTASHRAPGAGERLRGGRARRRRPAVLSGARARTPSGARRPRARLGRVPRRLRLDLRRRRRRRGASGTTAPAPTTPCPPAAPPASAEGCRSIHSCAGPPGCAWSPARRARKSRATLPGWLAWKGSKRTPGPPSSG